MEIDRFVGVNRRAEKIALKVVGALLTLFFVLFVSGLVKLF